MKNNDLFTVLPQKWLNYIIIIDHFCINAVTMCGLSMFKLFKILSNSTYLVERVKCECTTPFMFWSGICQQ